MSTIAIPSVKPAFDPTKPYQPADGGKPAFDPAKPYKPADATDPQSVIDQAHAEHGQAAIDQLTLDQKMAAWGKSRQQETQKQDATYVHQPLPIFRTAEQKAQDAQEFLKQPGAAQEITKRIALNHPDLAPDLKAAQYQVGVKNDGQAHDPAKVAANIKGIKSGDLDFKFGSAGTPPQGVPANLPGLHDPAQVQQMEQQGAAAPNASNATAGQVIKPLGLMASVAHGWSERQKALADYQDLTTMKDADIAKKYNAIAAAHDPDEPVPTPAGAGGFGKYTSLLGSEGMATAKMVVGGGLPALIPGAEEFAPAGAALAASPEYYKRSYAATFQSAYAEAKRKGMPDLDAVAQARDHAQYSAELAVMQGAAMGAAGARLGMNPVEGAGFSSKVASAVESAAKEGGANAIISAGTQALENRKGGRTASEGMLEAGLQGAIAPLVLGVVLKGVHKGIDPETYKSVVQDVAAKMPEPALNTELGHMIVDQSITPSQAKQIHTTVAAQRTADAGVPPDITAPAERMKIQDAMAERDQLASQMETAHPSLQPAYKEQLKGMDEKIAAMSGLTPKEETNAVPVKSPAKVPVQPAPDNSSSVGKGNEVKGPVVQENAGAQKSSTSKVYQVKNLDGEPLYAQITVDKNGKRSIGYKEDLAERLWTPAGKTYEGDISDESLLDANGFSEAKLHENKTDVQQTASGRTATAGSSNRQEEVRGEEDEPVKLRSPEEVNRIMTQDLPTEAKTKQVNVKSLDPATGEETTEQAPARKAFVDLKRQHKILDKILGCL